MNYKTVYASPLGTIILRSDGTYLTGLWFEGSRDSAKHTGVFAEEDLPIFAQTREWLDHTSAAENQRERFRIEWKD
ncbi:MAG: hypothetical protein ACLVJ6_05995 [Merdibacter sp.]